MRVTSKGQVTIPLPIRAEFGFKPGTEVEFVAEKGKVTLQARRKGTDPVESWLKESTGVAPRSVHLLPFYRLSFA